MLHISCRSFDFPFLILFYFWFIIQYLIGAIRISKKTTAVLWRFTIAAREISKGIILLFTKDMNLFICIYSKIYIYNGDSWSISGVILVLFINHNNLWFNHFVIKIAIISSNLTDTGEYEITTMSLSDIVNQLHDKYSLAYTVTTEKTNLTSLSIRSKKIDDLNTYWNKIKRLKNMR